MKYYIWTIGCQMNRAESSELSLNLESLGFEKVVTAREADIVLLNTCVVRQNAEDKVIGMLGYLKGIKSARPGMRIALTGCFVDSEVTQLMSKYPHVSCFFKPGEVLSFENWLLSENIRSLREDSMFTGACSVPVSSFVNIIQGCNNYCSYCIVPYRRGCERSRDPDEIVDQVLTLVEKGTREIVLLGQNVNAYGKDLVKKTDLAGLLYRLNAVNGLLRIRFLTNHPKDMTADLISAVASLDKVCHHITLPLQSGDDNILKAMNRHYITDDYMSLVGRIRDAVPDIALSTDIIVGFPGETEGQFRNTCQAIEKTGFDVVHVAAYSPRTGTAAAHLPDDVQPETKMARLYEIEMLQAETLLKRNSLLLGQAVTVLVEGKKGNKWYGRTYSDKLVFFMHEAGCAGRLVDIHIESTTSWSLRGTLSG